MVPPSDGAALSTGDQQLGELSSLAADVTEMRRELAEAATERQLILGALQALEGKLSEMVPRVEPVESDDVG
jgi:predicted nuclease with TOPRIM domain